MSSATVRMCLAGLLLSEPTPQCGYTLHKRYRGLFVGAAALNIGQVYATLKRLEVARLAYRAEVRSQGKRSATGYLPTAATGSAVERWLLTDGAASHDDWFMTVQARLAIAHVVGFDAAVVWALQHRALCAAFESTGQLCDDRPAPGWHRASIRARIDWLLAVRPSVIEDGGREVPERPGR